jgi:hypothetical protein
MSSADECSPRNPGRGGPSRFGPAAVIREAPPSGDAHLLSFFIDGAGQVIEERRAAPRCRPVVHRAWLGWWTRPGEFGSVPARLEDISQGGARLVTAKPPTEQQRVQAKVVAVTPGPDSEFIVRLAFAGPCPQSLYRTAIFGLDRKVK